MIAFSTITSFSLVRRLPSDGQERPSIYFLIAEASNIEGIRADIATEVQVQLGVKLRSMLASEMQADRLQDVFEPQSVVLITMDRHSPRLIESLDRNVVLLTRAASVLLLADFEMAERALVAAPNLRNRLADILAIAPDAGFGGAPA